MVDAGAAHFDGVGINVLWSLPFAGLLLSIALLPLLTPHFWEHHFGKVAAFWALAFLVLCAVVAGFPIAAQAVLHTFLLDYVPFILLLLTLFVVAGGIKVSGNLVGTPGTNTAMLAFGTLSASFLGTTGASMVLIRPVIRANQDRHYKIHVFVFFIFLVANIGGSLTPLGDPPLFLGFLKGVDFLWTLGTMLAPMLFVSCILLALFYLIDRLAWNRESPAIRAKSAATRQIRVAPVLAMLKAGPDGPFAPLLSLVSADNGRPVDAAYFWLTGGLSSFLDNAPTYLVFFNLAGGDAQEFMGPLASTLLAISAGAVFMGANTYIGNAPNFMVRSICEERGIKMPSFIGYMLWSGAILLPLFALFTWLWFS